MLFRSPLRKVTYKSPATEIVKSEEQRRLHKAFLRYHDPKSWPMIREALIRMGRTDLIGDGKQHLIPTYQPQTDGYRSARRKNSTPSKGDKAARTLLTQHTGLPPRATEDKPQWHKREQAKAAAEAKLRADRKRKPEGKGGKSNSPTKPR